MDHQEILVAAEVRKLAVKIAHNEREKYADEVDGHPDAASKLAEWEAAHSIDDYLEEAYIQIAGVANKLGSFERDRVSKMLEGNKYAQYSQRPPATSS